MLVTVSCFSTLPNSSSISLSYSISPDSINWINTLIVRGLRGLRILRYGSCIYLSLRNYLTVLSTDDEPSGQLPFLSSSIPLRFDSGNCRWPDFIFPGLPTTGWTDIRVLVACLHCTVSTACSCQSVFLMVNIDGHLCSAHLLS